MKTLTILLLTAVLTGCGAPKGTYFNHEGFAQDMQRTQAMQRQQSILNTNVTGVQTTDNQCVARCTKTGTQYGLCVKNCTY